MTKANRLTQSGSGTATSTYAYDQDGTRVLLTEGSVTTLFPSKLYNTTTGASATTTKHVYAGDELVATLEKVGTGSTTVRYAHLNHLGGTNLMTDASGTLTEVIDYYPFGQTRIDDKQGGYVGEKRKFTGHQPAHFFHRPRVRSLRPSRLVLSN